MMREIKKLHHDVVERLYRPSAAGWRNAKLNDLWNARRCPSEYAGDWMFVLKTMPQVRGVSMAVSTLCSHHLHFVSPKALPAMQRLGTNYSMDFVRQVAALPFRREGDGSPRVLLVTSRHTRRWIIPKGWPQAGCDDHHAAAAEARDEAGILGVVLPSSIGCYTYRKQLRDGNVDVRVTVFLLSITEELTSWLECEQRQRAWFTPAEAAALVDEPELQDLLRHIGTWSTD